MMKEGSHNARSKNELLPEAGSVTLEVLNPMGKAVLTPGLEPAPRIPDLNNKKICLMWNGKKHGDLVLKTLAKVLGEKFKNPEFIELPSGADRDWSEYPDEDTIAAMAEKCNCDAIIGAIGD